MKKKLNIDTFFKNHKDTSLWNYTEDLLLCEKGKMYILL